MKFCSTRSHEKTVSLSFALEQSLAEDGGLFVPEKFPTFSLDIFDGAQTLQETAQRWLKPFFEGDALEAELTEICTRAFSFPIPIKKLDRRTWVLELFHGPTCAFKDVGARFLAECLSRLSNGTKPIRTVLVATSGDTGGAVAAAFHGRPGVEVILLFPKGKVSARQEKQLTCWGGNVRAFSVRGNFDDCQKMAKSAFSDPWWKANRSLVSANSINIGRLLPQAAYYVAAGLAHRTQSTTLPVVIIPSGNLGNATAALWAKKTGLPLGKVILATNANPTITNFFQTGIWKPEPAVATLANAMDVGNPSNWERIADLYPKITDLKDDLDAVLANDAQITDAIRSSFTKWGEAFCPHTATGAFASNQYGSSDVILVATAHPAKFETIVEPVLKRALEVPAGLKKLLSQVSQVIEIAPTLTALTEYCKKIPH